MTQLENVLIEKWAEEQTADVKKKALTKTQCKKIYSEA